MAALSYYTNNWSTPFEQQQLNSDMSSIFAPQQNDLLPELNFDPPDSINNFDHLFDPNDLFNFDDEHFNNPIPCISSNHEFEQFNYPKRQKPYFFDYDDIIYTDQFNTPALFNESLVPNPYSNIQEYYLPPEITMAPLLPNLPTASPVYNNGSSVKKHSVSPSSIAARKRRKKITEKTQELGKLIPGSQKLNTAEMFQAAHKYIKFLQAQVGILEFIGSHTNQENVVCEEFHSLVESPLVQEKLYLAENCLVAKKFIQELSSDELLFQSKPQVLKAMRELPN